MNPYLGGDVAFFRRLDYIETSSSGQLIHCRETPGDCPANTLIAGLSLPGCNRHKIFAIKDLQPGIGCKQEPRDEALVPPD